MRSRRLIRVHLKDGQTLSGFQRRGQWGGHLILDLAKLHEDALNTHTLDGVVEIPRENVSFLQKLSAVEAI